MKKIIATALALMASPAAAGWQWVGGAADLTSAMFVETSTVRRNGTELHFWMDTRFKIPLSGGATRMMTFIRVNCDTYAWQGLKLSLYKGEERVAETDEPDKLDYAEPESAIYGALKSVCDSDYPMKEDVDRERFSTYLFSQKPGEFTNP